MIVEQVVVRDKEGISDTMFDKHKWTEGREKGDRFFSPKVAKVVIFLTD